MKVQEFFKRFPDETSCKLILKQKEINKVLFVNDVGFMKEGIFDNLMMRMVKSKPYTIKNISG